MNYKKIFKINKKKKINLFIIFYIFRKIINLFLVYIQIIKN